MSSFAAIAKRLRQSNEFHTITGTLLGFSVSYAYQIYTEEERKVAAEKDFQHKTFEDQVNYSMNIVEELPSTHPSGKKLSLKFRTIKEQNLTEAVPKNSALLNDVTEVCRNMDYKHPWVNLGKYQKLVLDSFVNEVSELFADGFTAAAFQKVPTIAEKFLVGLSYECEPTSKAARKLRVMLISQKSLQLLADEQIKVADVLLERAMHEPRVRALKAMAEEQYPVVGEVEIMLRVTEADSSSKDKKIQQLEERLKTTEVLVQELKNLIYADGSQERDN